MNLIRIGKTFINLDNVTQIELLEEISSTDIPSKEIFVLIRFIRGTITISDKYDIDKLWAYLTNYSKDIRSYDIPPRDNP